MDHSEARKKVCCICYFKAKRKLTESDVQAIKDVAIENYNPDNPDFPCGICTHCHVVLCEYRKGNTTNKLPLANDYNPGSRILTRGQSSCTCRICTIARANGVEMKRLKKREADLRKCQEIK